MRLITPKRLKENEAFMWQLADRQLDSFIARGECEYISGFAGPFTCSSSPTCWACPRRITPEFTDRMQHPPRRRWLGSTGDDTMAHSPLEYLYEQFTEYIEDRRREPRDDVLTGLATATFPDGSTPEVIDVVRVASTSSPPGRRPRSGCSAQRSS